MPSRSELRGELTRRRRKYIPGIGTYPTCCLCGKAIIGGGEIHESIITRGMIRSIDKACLILVPENSNLLHTACHPDCGRGDDEDFKKCANDLYLHEGKKVLEWLDRIEAELPTLVKQMRREYLSQIPSREKELL